MASISKTRRHFTEAAREAAALARQRKREHRLEFPEDHKLVMVVVRAEETPTGFGWQIRRFGHIQPVAQSPDHFSSPVDAGRSGLAALERLRQAAGD